METKTKRAIVMGASSGMGHEVAKILLQKGWHVGVAARREDKLEKLCSEYPQLSGYEKIDICNKDATEGLDKLIEKLGGMDVYIHMSGIGKQNSDLTPDIELATVETNGLGFTRMVGHAFRYFSENGGGHIVAISSIAGTKGLGPAPSYSATKAMQNTYLEAIEQLACNRQLGISITDIRPGFVDTPLIEGSNYPLKLNAERVARKIVGAVEHKRHVSIIDWRYRLLVFFWRLIPSWLWRRIPLCKR